MNVFLDGTVDMSGNISVWTVVDNNYHKKARFCFSDHCIPSRLYQERPDIVKALKKKFISVFMHSYVS